MPLAPAPKLQPVPRYIAECRPYEPGKPIEELERELGIRDIIKLASNESPIGASPKALAVLQDPGERTRLYPDAAHYYLREKLASHNGVTAEEIMVGNGSNEIIDLLIRSYCTAEHNIVSCGAAFVAYRVSAKVHGVEYREAEIRDDLVADLTGMQQLVDERTRIVFLPNPNNPTGTYVNRTELLAFLEQMRERQVIVVLDSAYLEYARAVDYPDPFECYRQFSNIVISRTFSKAYGLAGLRVGYGIAHPDILAPLWKVKMPFNVNSLALSAAMAALDDPAHLKQAYEVNAHGIEYLTKELQGLGLRPFPSEANFVLVDFGGPVADIYDKLLHNGIITRPVAGFGLKQHLRITVGLPPQNERLVKALRGILET